MTKGTKQYSGIEFDLVRELKQIVEDNAPLKKPVAELSLGKAVLQDVLSRIMPRPALMKDVVGYVTACHGYSERRPCLLTRQRRSTQRKPMTRDPRLAIRQSTHEIAHKRIRIFANHN